MPFYEEALKIAEEMQDERRIKPDIWMTTHRQGKRNLYVMRTRDTVAVNAMISAQDMLDALKCYQQMCDCASLAWKQHVDSLIRRVEGKCA